MALTSTKPAWLYVQGIAKSLGDLPPEHAIHVLARTYGLALSLSAGPAILSTVLSQRSLVSKRKIMLRLLGRNLGVTGFPFIITLALSGGFLQSRLAQASGSTPTRASTHTGDRRSRIVSNFLSAYLALALLQRGTFRTPKVKPLPGNTFPLTLPDNTTSISRGLSPTWDLTFILLVRALDAWTQKLLPNLVSPANDVDGRALKVAVVGGRVDAALFWAASSRIMWCFIYKPSSLPPSYVRWIGALADIDDRLFDALRAIRTGAFSYVKGITPPGLLTSMAVDMDCPSSWGDPACLSATGGAHASNIYEAIGASRSVGGIPCELVHGHIDHKSCVANATRRGAVAFVKAAFIYSPVHFLPVILTRPRKLLESAMLLSKTVSVFRSSLFLSTFLASIYMTICVVRTMVVARLLPNVSHDFYDGPFGGVMAGCLMCGSSIFIEDPKRRGEMAMYVLPRAIRTCLPNRWLSRHGRLALVLERFIFALSLAFLLDTQRFRPEALRGLSKWALTYITKGRVGKSRPIKPTPPPPDHMSAVSLHDNVH